MKKHLFLLLFVLTTTVSKANWTPVSTTINDNFNAVKIWDTLAVLIGDHGIYVNPAVDVMPGNFTRFVMNNTDSITYNKMQLIDMVEISSGELIIAANDTVAHKAILFKYNVLTNNYAFLYTSPTFHQFNGIGKRANNAIAVGNNGFMVEYDGSTSTIINLGLTGIQLNDFQSGSATNANYIILADGFYISGFGSFSVQNPSINIISDNLQAALFYSSSQSIASGANYYVIQGNVTENTYYNYGDLNTRAMIKVGSVYYLATDHGVFSSFGTLPLEAIEYQPSSNNYNLNGISYNSAGSHLMACGNNGALLFSSSSNIPSEPYLEIVNNYLCEGYFPFIKGITGSSTNVQWYLNGFPYSAPAQGIYPGSILDSVTSISLKGSNANFSDSISVVFHSVEAAQIQIPLNFIDTILCREDIIELELLNTEIDRTYTLYKAGSSVPYSPTIQGNGASILLNSFLTDEIGPYNIEINSIYGNCAYAHQDTFTVTVQKPHTTIHPNLQNIEVNEEVTYYAKTNGASNYLWNFDNNANISSSNLQSPSVLYTSPSTPNVELITWTNEGCYDTVQRNMLPIITNAPLNDYCYMDTTELNGFNNYGGRIQLQNSNHGYFWLNTSNVEGAYSRFGDGKYKNGRGYYLSKFDKDDILKWNVRIGVQNQSDIVDIGMLYKEGQNGVVFIAARTFPYNSYFYDNAGDSIPANNGLLIVKLDSLGKILWSTQTNSYFPPYALGVDQNNQPTVHTRYSTNTNLYFNTNGTLSDSIQAAPNTQFDGLTFKLNSNGEVIQKIVHRHYDVSDISFDTSNNMYLLVRNGYYHNVIDTQGDTNTYSSPNIPGIGSYVFAFDSTGTFKWSFVSKSSPGSASGLSIRDYHMDTNGDSYLLFDNEAASTHQQIILDGAGNVTSISKGDLRLIKINMNGLIVWETGVESQTHIGNIHLEKAPNTDTLYILAEPVKHNGYFNTEREDIVLGSTNGDSIKFPSFQAIYFLAKYDTSGVLHRVCISNDDHLKIGHELTSDFILDENGFRIYKKMWLFVNVPPPNYNFFGATMTLVDPNVTYYTLFNDDCGYCYYPNLSFNLYDTICVYDNYTLADGTQLDSVASSGWHTGYTHLGNNIHTSFETYLEVNTDKMVDQMDTVCFGYNYTYPDLTIAYDVQAPLTYTSVLSNNNTCDSIITTYLSTSTLISTLTNYNDDSLFYEYPIQDYNYQWLNCNNTGYSEIPGANESHYIVSGNGEYSLVVSNGYCTDTLDCIVIDYISGVGIDENHRNTIQVYPNPSRGELNIYYPSKEAYDVRVFSASGALVKEQSFQSQEVGLNLTTLLPGVYWIEINDFRERIIIQ